MIVCYKIEQIRPMPTFPSIATMCYDYAALSSIAEFKILAEPAQVIIAVDKNGRGQGIPYGREIIRAIAHEVMPPQHLPVLALAIEFGTDEVENLCTDVETVKGFHEWD